MGTGYGHVASVLKRAHNDPRREYGKGKKPLVFGELGRDPLRSHLDAAHYGTGPDPQCRACREIQERYPQHGHEHEKGKA